MPEAEFKSALQPVVSSGGQSLAFSAVIAGRRLFIKTRKTEGKTHEEKQLINEIKTLESIDHRNVVPRIGHIAKPLGIILDWVEGGFGSVHHSAA